MIVLLTMPISDVMGLITPPSRASMWKLGYNSPTNFNDNQLNCGGKSVKETFLKVQVLYEVSRFTKNNSELMQIIEIWERYKKFLLAEICQFSCLNITHQDIFND